MLLVLRSKLWHNGNATALITGAECTASAGTITPIATSTFFGGGGGVSKGKLARQRSFERFPERKSEPKRRPEREPQRQPRHEPKPEPVSVNATALLIGASAEASAGELQAFGSARAILPSAEVVCQAGEIHAVGTAMPEEGIDSITSDLMLLEMILRL